MLVDFNKSAILPAPLARLRNSPAVELAIAVVPWLVAVCGWVSLTPYFFSGVSRHQLVAAFITCGAFPAIVLAGKMRVLSAAEIAGSTFLTLFIVYITALPATDGSITKWVFVLPMLGTLSIMSDEMRVKTIRAFTLIFAMTLLPGIAISAWIAVGLPIEFQSRPYYDPVMAASGANYLFTPVAMFVGGNSIYLPWGGVLARMTAIYDEPGLIGTIGAFLLAADRFRLNRWANIAMLIAGLLSVSLAFVILASIGLFVRFVGAAYHKRVAVSVVYGVALVSVVAVGFLATGKLSFHAGGTPSISVTVQTVVPGKAPQAVPVENQEIRQTQFVDNRSLPPMSALLHKYWHSDVSTIMFGIASDAAAVAAPTSQVFTRLFTDYGAVGFALLFLGFAALSLGELRHSHAKAWLALFLLCFALSFYQRPVIWMPYALMIYFCGMALAGTIEELKRRRP